LAVDVAVAAKSFLNSPIGFSQLRRWLRNRDIERVHACLESTGGWSEDLATYLHEHGHVISVVNSLAVKAFDKASFLARKPIRLTQQWLRGAGHRRNRSWVREHPDQRDEAWFTREIAPRLDAFTLREIAEATGLSFAACSRIRAGAKVPHPRHWSALAGLAGQ
jgi:hypothetical protein